MELKQLTVEELSRVTASKSSAPGGGSISAMAGAFSAALASMASKLTEGKAGYEAAWERVRQIDARAEALRLELLDDIQRDTSSFDAFMEALTLPKGTGEEKALRAKAMQDALKGACAVPMEVAGKALEAMKLALETVRIANVNVASDSMVGVLMGRAAVLGALSNVRINLDSIKDEAYVRKMSAACDEMEEKVRTLEREGAAVLGKRI